MSRITVEQVTAVATLVTTLAPVAKALGDLAFGVVRSVEANMPDGSTSKQKLDAALTQIKVYMGPIVDAAPSLFEELINGTVATLNAIGEFKKASAPSPSPQPVLTT